MGVITRLDKAYDRWIRKKLSKMQAAIILAGVYVFLQMTANIAATKVIVIWKIVMDAGIIYSFTFTWRDLIHKQLGKKAAQTAIIVAAVLNILMALYFVFVIKLPAEPSWAAIGGQKAWELLFGLVPRVVFASIISQVISELVDTEVYEWWTLGIGKKRPQWTRVIISNSVSIPVDSFVFPLIAFFGVLPFNVLVIMFLSNILIKMIITALSFWMIYFVPEKPLFDADAED
ncbi:MAG: queuosine precursor transporter [Candidatus Woesearchaeota archaeon]|nr:queuosine precursor transporter [Candidatus Woesearchaeota archaeon]